MNQTLRTSDLCSIIEACVPTIKPILCSVVIGASCELWNVIYRHAKNVVYVYQFNLNFFVLFDYRSELKSKILVGFYAASNQSRALWALNYA